MRLSTLITRATLPVIALLAASVMDSAPVYAQQTSPQAAWLAANVVTAAPGDSVSFGVAGFGGGTTVTVTLLSPGSVALGTMTAYHDGTGVLTVVVPTDTPLGDHSVSANGLDSNGKTLSVSTLLAVAPRVAELNIAPARSGGFAADATGPGGLVTIFGGLLLLIAVRVRVRHRP